MEKLSTSELNARVAFLENIIESLPLGLLVLDSGGKILLTNQTQEKMSKVNRQKFVGDVFHERWKDVIERAGYQDQYFTLLNKKEPFDFVFHDVLPQFHDTIMSGICSASPLANDSGFVMVHLRSQQILEDKYTLSRLAQNLAEAKIFLQNLVDSSPNAVFTVDQDGTIRSANKTASKLFGSSQGDILFKNISLLFIDKPLIHTLTDTESGMAGMEKLCIRKNGEHFAAKVLVSSLQKECDGMKKKLIIITDISRERALEKKLGIAEELAIYSELIAGIFHQLNNPLVGVVNFAALLQEKVTEDDPLRPTVETIYEAGCKCQTLVTTLMKGFFEPQSVYSRIDLSEVLENSIDDYLVDINDISDSKVLLKRSIDRNLPSINGNSLQLGQVFQNIINNSFQAMREGGELKVCTAVDKVHNEIFVRFSDTGCGIPHEIIDKIFTPFFSTKTNTGGGLGLSFCFQVIKKHKGRIEVESIEGKACTMIVILPFESSVKSRKRRMD